MGVARTCMACAGVHCLTWSPNASHAKATDKTTVTRGNGKLRTPIPENRTLAGSEALFCQDVSSTVIFFVALHLLCLKSRLQERRPLEIARTAQKVSWVVSTSLANRPQNL